MRQTSNKSLADDISIPDQHLKDELLESFDEDKSGTLSKEELEKVYYLTVDFKNDKADFTGMEYLVNLDQVTNDDLSKLTNVIEEASIVRISSPEITSLTAFKDAELSDLDVSGCTNLKDINTLNKDNINRFISSEKTPTSASGEFKEFCLSGSTISD